MQNSSDVLINKLTKTEDNLNSIFSKLDDNSLQAISQKANASPDKAKSAMATPLVTGYLGKESGCGDGNLLGNVNNSYMNSEKKQESKSQNVINQLPDQNNDGSIIDDIVRMGMSFLKKRSK